MAEVSRRKLANYFADQLLAGKKGVVDQLAAYLIDTGRTKEAELIVRDIEDALATRGTVVADIQSAHALTKETQAALSDFLKRTTQAKRVELRHVVDESLLGGVRIGVPGAEIDTTLRRKLTNLKASKV